MIDKKGLTKEECNEIDNLVQRAINSPNKASAKPYVRDLMNTSNSLQIQGNYRIVLGELIAYVKTASGRVKEKDHWIDAINGRLSVLRRSIELKDL